MGKWVAAPLAAVSSGFAVDLYFWGDGRLSSLRLRPTGGGEVDAAEYDRAAVYAWTSLGCDADALSMRAEVGEDGAAVYSTLIFDD